MIPQEIDMTIHDLSFISFRQTHIPSSGTSITLMIVFLCISMYFIHTQTFRTGLIDYFQTILTSKQWMFDDFPIVFPCFSHDFRIDQRRRSDEKTFIARPRRAAFVAKPVADLAQAWDVFVGLGGMEGEIPIFEQVLSLVTRNSQEHRNGTR